MGTGMLAAACRPMRATCSHRRYPCSHKLALCTWASKGWGCVGAGEQGAGSSACSQHGAWEARCMISLPKCWQCAWHCAP